MRGRGIEPPRIAPLVPKTSASTNFATRARVVTVTSIAEFLFQGYFFGEVILLKKALPRVTLGGITLGGSCRHESLSIFMHFVLNLLSVRHPTSAVSRAWKRARNMPAARTIAVSKAVC